MLVPPHAIGQLVPSSNRTVERTTEALLSAFPGWGACYARIPYRPDGSGQPQGGYDLPAIRDAVELLSHAGVEALSWNGTKGAGDGFDVDRALGKALAATAGCPVTTVSLDTLAILGRLGAKRVGLVAPGSLAQARLTAAGFASQGHEVVAMRAFGLDSNLASAMLTPEAIAAAVRAVHAEARPDAVLIWSTNMPGLPVVAPLEAELGIAVVDSASVGVWGCLAALRVDGTPALARGRIFGVLG